MYEAELPMRELLRGAVKAALGAAEAVVRNGSWAHQDEESICPLFFPTCGKRGVT
jgi:hypothetical protein